MYTRIIMTAYIVTIIFGLIGFVIASIVRSKKVSQRPLVCPFGSRCDSVIYSKYSKFLGIEVCNFGIVYYGIIILMYGGFILFPSMVPPLMYTISFLMTIFAVLFSLYLVVIQLFVIKEWCAWCMASAFFSTAILISSGFTIDSVYILLIQYQSIIEIIHILAIGLGLGTAIVADIFFMKFLSDYEISESESEVLETLSQIIWFALGIIVLTSIALFLSHVPIFALSTRFIIESAVIGVIIGNVTLLNLFVAPKLIMIAFGESIRSDQNMYYLRKFAFAFSAISLVSWVVLFLVSVLQPVQYSLQIFLILYGLIIICSVMLSQVLEYYISRRSL